MILALGTRGDVEPSLALAIGLIGEGYAVAVAATDDFRDLLIRSGVEHISLNCLLPRPNEVPQILGWAMAHAHENKILALEGAQIWLRSVATEVARSLVEALRPTDVVVTGILTLSCALALREAFGCKVAAAVFAPCIPTAYGESLIEALRPTRCSIVNRLGGAITWRVGVRWSRPSGAMAREILGLRHLPLVSAHRQILSVPVLLAVSSLLVPIAPDWPATVHTTGPWTNTKIPPGRVSSTVEKFLDAESTTLYVGFGSVGHPGDIDLFSNATRKAHIRVIANVPRGAESLANLIDERIMFVDDVPHSWLFPRVDGVIHHGSAGTTTTALRAGKPSTAVPHQFDQFYYAQRLRGLGVGPSPIGRKRLTVDDLVGLMRGLVNDSCAAQYRRQGVKIGRLAIEEDGVSKAIDILREIGFL